MRMRLAYFELFQVVIDSEAWTRDSHWAIRNEWDSWSRKKWKKEFQAFESTPSDSSLSVIIAKRRTLRAVKHEM